jgi:signal transduction histidine kinase
VVVVANQRETPADVVLTVAAACAAVIAVFGHKETITWFTALFAALTLVPWLLRWCGVSIGPVAFVVATAVPAVTILLGTRNPGGMFPLMLTVVEVTRSRSKLASGVAISAAAGGITTLAVLEGTIHETGMIYFLGGIGVSAMAGVMLGRQERLVDALRAAHDLHHEHAAAAERTRIAREVHDVVAHSLTVTMLHVTGARRALATNPDRAAEALERAESVGRQSLDSIRQVVGLLRSNEHDNGSPSPQLGDIPALIEQFRSAGLSVSVEMDTTDVTPDPTTSLTAYRVVQEALSNALQHAPGASVSVRVAGESAGSVLRIVAENPMRAASPTSHGQRSGLGLRGMSERVRAAGGTVEAGRTNAATWRVEAALPVRRLADVMS